MSTVDERTDGGDATEEERCHKKYLGKHRGTVTNNIDPKRQGRIQVLVPDVSIIPLTTWALPSLPVGGMQMGLFAVPPPGSAVWIEFEQGDPDFPIWTGCFWGSPAEVPAMAHAIPPGVPGVVLQTPLQNGIMISDVPGPAGGILLKTTQGAMISVSDAGITISNGKGAVINMSGSTISIVGAPVDVNAGALTILG